jgi:hypothetical protein
VGGFQAVEKPGAQGPLELLVPWLGVPAAFVLGLLDQANVAIGLDQFNALLDELTVSFRPLGGDLSDRRRAMPLKPGRFQFACSHLAGYDDLKGTLAEFNSGRFELLT